MKPGYTMLIGGLLLSVGMGLAHAATPREVWITLDQKTLTLLQQVDPAAKSLESRYMANGSMVQGLVNVDKIHIVPVDESKLGLLSARVHSQLNHCAGFVAYGSLQEARAALQPRVESLAFTRPDYTITHQALVQPMLAQQTDTQIAQTIQDLSSFTNRYYDGTYGAQASDWLKNKWQGMANGRADITVEQVYRGTDKQASVVLTIAGSSQPEQVVVVGAHLDSVNHNDRGNQSHETARAPGADDDASGVAGLTETLRVLLANGYKPARTLKLMAYSGEEFGLYGSNYIASDYARRNVDVVGVLQLDMTNYKGSPDDIYLMDDYTDAAQNQFVEDLAGVYLPQLQVNRDLCGYGCSDHFSWHNQGYPASMPFESAMRQMNPNIHSSRDTYANSGGQALNALKFTRLALAFAVELAGSTDDGDTTTPPPADDVLENGVPRNGLSGDSKSEKIYTVTLPAGASNLVIATRRGNGDMDLYTRFGAAPTDSSFDCRPYRSGNQESCSVAAPSAGTYYVMLKGYQAYAGVSLVANWTVAGTPSSDTDKVFSNTTRYAVPDRGAVTSTINVSGRSGQAPAALKVAVKVLHPYRGDLRITLITSNGKSVVLKNFGRDNGVNVDTVYTVNAADQPANGAWKLKVEDVYAGDIGSLEGWSLTF